MNHLNSAKTNTAGASLDRPQYNATLRLIKKLNDIQLNKAEVCLDEQEIERIHEKASVKLNLHKPVFDGLVPVEPDEEDFLKCLEIKHRHKLKPQISTNKLNNQKPPDLMEFYPSDLIKEFPEVEIEYLKPAKLNAIKASPNLFNDPVDKYFKWN